MFRRHFFLIIAVIVVAAMGVAGTWKVLTKPSANGPAGPGAGGAAAGRPGAAGPGGAPGRAGAPVTAAMVSQRVFTDRLDVQGVAKGRQSVTLTSSGAQVVDKVMFKSGDIVRKGQVLLQLRRDAEDAAIAQAQAQVDLAKSTANRWTKLADQGLAPAATAEQYQSAYITAQTTLDAAKARLQDRVISAPFAGTVGLSDIAPGALISPGTAIVTLDDLSVITVDIDVPDRNLAMIKEGVTLDATSDSYPGEHYSGRIAKIDTRVDERTRSFKARAELPNPGGRLKPGMLLHVGIDRGTHMGLAAPESAVQFSGGQASVFVIMARGGAAGGAGAPGGASAGAAPAAAAAAPAGAASGTAPPRPAGFVALQRPIVAGIDECGFVEVKDGLQLGDRIVADGLNKLTPNQPVMVIGGAGARPRGGPGAPGAAAPAGAAPKGGAPGPTAAAGANGHRGAGERAMAGRMGAGGPGRGGVGAGRGPGARTGSAGVQPMSSNGERCAAQLPGHAGPGGPGGPGAHGGMPSGAPMGAPGKGGPGHKGGAEAAGMPPVGGRSPAGAGRRAGVETAQ